MADFCKQCSYELFGPEVGNDFLRPGEDPEKTFYALCEGCGFCIVKADGTCLAHELAAHGQPAHNGDFIWPKEDT